MCMQDDLDIEDGNAEEDIAKDPHRKIHTTALTTSLKGTLKTNGLTKR